MLSEERLDELGEGLCGMAIATIDELEELVDAVRKLNEVRRFVETLPPNGACFLTDLALGRQTVAKRLRAIIGPQEGE